MADRMLCLGCGDDRYCIPKERWNLSAASSAVTNPLELICPSVFNVHLSTSTSDTLHSYVIVYRKAIFFISFNNNKD